MTSSRGRLLVIDDEPDLREMLAFILSTDGYEVVTADSGVAAVAEAQARRFNLAVTNLRMPDMDGLETLVALKRIDASMEVIIATGYASEETAVECMERGAYGYIRKPFEHAELQSLIEGALGRRSAAATTRPP